jgi:hypothetical protein
MNAVTGTSTLEPAAQAQEPYGAGGRRRPPWAGTTNNDGAGSSPVEAWTTPRDPYVRMQDLTPHCEHAVEPLGRVRSGPYDPVWPSSSR